MLKEHSHKFKEQVGTHGVSGPIFFLKLKPKRLGDWKTWELHKL